MGDKIAGALGPSLLQRIDERIERERKALEPPAHLTALLGDNIAGARGSWDEVDESSSGVSGISCLFFCWICSMMM
jgi:hypothetical protein